MTEPGDIHDTHINQPVASSTSLENEKGVGGTSQTPSKDFQSKSWMVFAGMCVLAVAIIIKIFVLQIFPDEAALSLGQNFTYKVNEIDPVRGQIFSSDGSLLATSVPEYEIRWDYKAGIDPKEFKAKIDSLALGFSRLFGDRSTAEYKKLFTDAKKEKDRYKEIIDHVDYFQLQAIKKFPIVRNGQFKSGFVFVQKNKREKPFGSLAARTIGLEREDNKVGIELAFDEELSGKKGQQLQEKIAGGLWKPMSDDFIEEPQPGSDVVATIDIHLQDVAQAALKRQLEQHNATWGCVVLMEVKTGYVRAIANLTKNPDSGEYQEMLNLAISQGVEPGSTMKLASIMACLDEGLIDLDDSIATGNGSWRIHDMTLTDSNHDKGGNGTISVEEVFEKSSNVGTAKIIKQCFDKNPQQFLNKLNSFGLGQKANLQLKGEGQPRLYTNVKDKGWSGLSLTQLSIGYEMQLTPLQILTFYNAVANDGEMVKPLFVQEIRRNGLSIDRIKPEVIREKFCSKETIKKCKKMMEGVTEKGGTADNAFKDCIYKVAGKTGTAKIHENGSYDFMRHRASFVGYFPADNPQYSCIVVIHDPKNGNYYGGTIAAPVFKELAVKIYSTQMEYHVPETPADSTIIVESKIPVSKNGSLKELTTVFKGLNIPVNYASNSEWVGTATKGNMVEISEKKIQKGIVPNVVGMGLQDALYILENQGMKVKVSGYGTVKRQSIPPGNTTKTNPYITIELL